MNVLNSAVVAKISTELCRLNHSENHNIASIMGGVGSQEAVKMITGQYVRAKLTQKRPDPTRNEH